MAKAGQPKQRRPNRRRDFRDQKLGKLYVLCFDEEQQKWCCLCDCGKMVHVSRVNLTRKKNPTRDCGCVKEQKQKEKERQRQWKIRERKRKERENNPTPEEIEQRCREIREEKHKKLVNGSGGGSWFLSYRDPKVFKLKVE